jgi:hypothetical protein
MQPKGEVMDCSRLFAYLRNRRGATAVEFVLTFPFFIAIVFMIAETSIYFFAVSNAEKAVHNYSREIVEMNAPVIVEAHEERIWNQLGFLMNRRYFQSLRFTIDTAMPTTDFSSALQDNFVGANIFDNRNRPIFFRVVLQPRGLSYALTRPFWLAIGAAQGGGLLAPIDILIVIPFPARD